jgi:hypothetical protein
VLDHSGIRRLPIERQIFERALACPDKRPQRFK